MKRSCYSCSRYKHCPAPHLADGFREQLAQYVGKLHALDLLDVVGSQCHHYAPVPEATPQPRVSHPGEQPARDKITLPG